MEFYPERRVEIAQTFINTVENTIFKIVKYPTRLPVIDEDIR
ncbi:hypothetical protein [Dapis sp. BLCC M229]